MSVDTEQPLATAIRRLQERLDNTIQQIAGPQGLAAVVKIREMSCAAQTGHEDVLRALEQAVAALEADERRVVVRAFSILLDLMNVAEDRERTRILRERERAAHPAPRAESIRDAVAQWAADGLAADEVQAVLDQLNIELVLTAHPTEAKRRSIRGKLRRIRELLSRIDQRDLLDREAADLDAQLQAELTKLWQTDFIRPWPPTVIQEVERGLSIMPVLWEVVPEILRDFRQALTEFYPGRSFRVPPLLRFASWIGGDRDGHPGVTAEVTAQTLIWLRRAAIAQQRETVCDLFGSLSLSARQAPVSEELRDAVSTAVRNWPELEKLLTGIPPNEMYRRWLGAIDWRLHVSAQHHPAHPLSPGAYASSEELAEDVRIIQRSLSGAHNDVLVHGEIQRWLDQIGVFGLHLARLDVRQDARYYEAVMAELLSQAGVAADFVALSEADRQRVLLESLGKPLSWDDSALSGPARETLALMMLLRRTLRNCGGDALGSHVISMTRTASDVLVVLWLWEWSRTVDGGHSRDAVLYLPIIPLFETIDYLRDAAATMTALLDIDAYRSYVARHGLRQTVMIGYSDSTKDGGYLAACWALHRAQTQIHEVARRRGVAVTFFHGRGGSLGRGGGPTARAILSLPAATFDGSLRLTEQGEVLAERYDHAPTAHRHLEQVTWSALLSSTRKTTADIERWRQTVEWLADRSFRAYRRLTQDPGFVGFFRQATPIGEIEQLPIGSRPARRKAGGSLSDLRAIPWVFSWTQIRCLVPAWYGLGSAVAELCSEAPERGRELADIYQAWPFFRASVDNAELALAKTDLTVASVYFRLTDDSDLAERFAALIVGEYHRCCDAVLQMTGQPRLLENVAWLRDSILRRSPFVNALNLMQVDLLRQLRSAAGTETPDANEWAHLIRLAIQGIAAGMRTTG
jgi:phosphoenolpyruvate carboxylase